VATAIGLGAGFVGGVVLSVAGAVLVVRFQRQRLRIGYRMLSAGPIVPFETKPGDPLRVVVRRDAVPATVGEVLTEEQREYSDAGRVYGFRIVLRNTGGETIRGDEKSPGLDALFELDESATILSITVESPALRPDDVLTDKGYQSRANLGRCWLSYLNKREEATISIQSVGNRDNSCRVTARAPALEPAYDMVAAGMRTTDVISAAFAAVGIVAFGVGNGWGISEYGVLASAEEWGADMPRGGIIMALQAMGVAMALSGAYGLALMRVLRRRRERTSAA